MELLRSPRCEVHLEDHPRTCKWLGSPLFISHETAMNGRGPITRSLGDETDHHGQIHHVSVDPSWEPILQAGMTSLGSPVGHGTCENGKHTTHTTGIPWYSHMGVSKNSGTPKSSILIGFSIINHPFWGTIIFGNSHIFRGFENGNGMGIVWVQLTIFGGPMSLGVPGKSPLIYGLLCACGFNISNLSLQLWKRSRLPTMYVVVWWPPIESYVGDICFSQL